MATFRVPVLRSVYEYGYYGYYEVEAVSLEDALAKAKNLHEASDPSNMEIIDGKGNSMILEDKIVEIDDDGEEILI